MNVGEKIKLLRKGEELTQKELAEKLNIGGSTLACYETNKREVPNAILVEIAKFFGTTTDYLLGLED